MCKTKKLACKSNEKVKLIVFRKTRMFWCKNCSKYILQIQFQFYVEEISKLDAFTYSLFDFVGTEIQAGVSEGMK